MSKAYSPTENIFALLALADEPAQKKESKPSTAPKKNVKTDAQTKNAEPTPAARAEAKKQQEAEAKAKQKADDDRKAAEAERQRVQKALLDEQQKKFDELDSTGFSKQRAQAKKDSKIRPVAPEPPKQTGKGGQKRNNNNENAPKYHKEGGADSGSNTPNRNQNRPPRDNNNYNKGGYNRSDQAKPDGQQGGQGRKHNNNHQGDKHSRTGVAQGFKKGGAGAHNWDDSVAAGLAVANITTESSEVQNVTAAFDDDFANAPVAGAEETTTTENVEGAESTAPDTVDDAVDPEDEKESKKLSLDEYHALQAEKRKALEALVKPAQPRALSDAELQSLAKFNRIENDKVKKPAQPAAPKPTNTATPAPAARKGQTAVALENYVKVYAPPREGARDGPRYPRGGNRDGQRTNTPKPDARENAGNKNAGGAPRENRGPPRQRNQNFNNSPAQNRGPRDNRAKKDAAFLDTKSPEFVQNFPTL